MQAPAPPLLPLLRSRLQAELLMLVLLSPGREWSLTELADRARGSVSSAQREMARAGDNAGDVTNVTAAHGNHRLMLRIIGSLNG
jgi:hypothetical protein